MHSGLQKLFLGCEWCIQGTLFRMSTIVKCLNVHKTAAYFGFIIWHLCYIIHVAFHLAVVLSWGICDLLWNSYSSTVSRSWIPNKTLWSHHYLFCDPWMTRKDLKYCLMPLDLHLIMFWVLSWVPVCLMFHLYWGGMLLCMTIPRQCAQ